MQKQNVAYSLYLCLCTHSKSFKYPSKDHRTGHFQETSSNLKHLTAGEANKPDEVWPTTQPVSRDTVAPSCGKVTEAPWLHLLSKTQTLEGKICHNSKAEKLPCYEKLHFMSMRRHFLKCFMSKYKSDKQEHFSWNTDDELNWAGTTCNNVTKKKHKENQEMKEKNL